MRAYSLDLRERVVAAYQEIPIITQVAKRFKISDYAARTYIRAHQAGQSLAPKPRPGRTRKLGAETHQIIRNQVATHPDATLMEHVELFYATTGIQVCFKTMDRTFTRLGIGHKKNGLRY